MQIHVMHLAIIFLATQLAAATLTSTPATTCHINGAPCTTVAITPHPSWAPAIGGTSWISIAQTGWPLATYISNGTVVSFSEVFSLASMPSSAMVTWAADDSAALWLNGRMVAPEAPTAGNAYTVCSDIAPTCTAHSVTDILPWLTLGDNALRFDVGQRGGYSFGLNYAVEIAGLDDALNTPESGTWIIGLVLAVIVALCVIDSRLEARKIRALDARVDRLTKITDCYRDTLLHIASCSRDKNSQAVARKALEESK